MAKSVSAYVFLKTLTEGLPEGAALIETHFASDPSDATERRGRWSGTRLDPEDFKNKRKFNFNGFVTTGAFSGDRRKKAEFVAQSAIMVDDVGTGSSAKIKPEDVALEPTFRLETSPGNCQYWYVFSDPIRDRRLAEAVIDGLIALGLTSDGADPGMSAVTRYGRYPQTYNNKAKYLTPHRVSATWGEGKPRFTVEDIIEAFDLDVDPDNLGDAGGERQQDLNADQEMTLAVFWCDPLGRFVYEKGLVKEVDHGVVHVTCPWVDDHTDAQDDGSAFIVNEDGTLGYKCHHGSCQDKGLARVWEWARENGGYTDKTDDWAEAVDADALDVAALVADAMEQDSPDRAILNLKTEYPRYSYQIHEAAKLYEQDLNLLNDLAAARERLADTRFPPRLKVEKMFPRVLADAIVRVAEAMPTAEEFIATPMIPVLASQMGTKHTLVVRRDSGQTATPIFWSLVIGSTGDMKSPAMSVSVKALTQLESEAIKNHARALAEHKSMAEVAADEDVEAPPPPVEVRYAVNDSTAAVRAIIHAQNKVGFVEYRDEGSAFITSFGRFSAKGSDNGDKEAMLSEFDGGALLIDRKGTNGNTERLFAETTAIQRCGTTQTATLARLMGDHNDETGLWARFLLCMVPAPASTVDPYGDHDDERGVSITGTIKDIVKRIEALEPTEYSYTVEARVKALKFQNHLTKLQNDSEELSIKAALPKFKTYLHRFALFFHILHGVVDGDVAAEIGIESVDRAIHAVYFYLGQYNRVMDVNSPERRLVGDALALGAYLRKKGPRTIRELMRASVLRKRGLSKVGEYRSRITLLVENGDVEVDVNDRYRWVS